MHRLSEEIKDKLINNANRYNDNEFELYSAEAGWEDWMEEYTKAGDGEEPDERELNEITKVQKEIFALAHK